MGRQSIFGSLFSRLKFTAPGLILGITLYLIRKYGKLSSEIADKRRSLQLSSRQKEGSKSSKKSSKKSKSQFSFSWAFLSRMFKLLKILFPSILSKQTIMALLLAVCLMVRTYCDLMILRMTTVVEKHM